MQCSLSTEAICCKDQTLKCQESAIPLSSKSQKKKKKQESYSCTWALPQKGICTDPVILLFQYLR